MSERLPVRWLARGWPVWAVGVSLLAGAEVAQPSRMRIAATVALVVMMAAVGVLWPRRLLIGLMVWLPMLGLLRRLASEIAPAANVDPLLAVGPAAIVVLLLESWRRSDAARGSKLSRWIGAMCLLAVLGALKPGQGGAVAGLSALLFILVPMLAFWIGRELCDDATLTRLLKLIAAIAIPIGVYGMYQVLHGFPPWDEQWIQKFGYAALNVGGYIRPFGTFSSAAEFAYYLGIGVLVLIVFNLRSARAPIALVVAGALLVAISFEASRGIIVMLVITASLLLAAWRRVPLLLSGLAAAGGLALLVFVAGSIGLHDTSTSATSAFSAHLVGGLSHPFNPNYSTTSTHIGLILRGMSSALHHPIGIGDSAITIAGAKFGNAVLNTESDPSNMAVALGLPGLTVYLGILVFGFRLVYGLARDRRDPLSFAALAVVSVMALQWMNGGQYAVAPLPWLILGWAEATRCNGRTAEIE